MKAARPAIDVFGSHDILQEYMGVFQAQERSDSSPQRWSGLTTPLARE
jgi:hypothetical protein